MWLGKGCGMRATVLLRVVIITLICLSCSRSFCNQDPLVGAWTGVDSSGECNSLVFFADGSAALMLEGKICLDGKSEGGSLIWVVDRTQSPIHLDLIGTNA